MMIIINILHLSQAQEIRLTLLKQTKNQNIIMIIKIKKTNSTDHKKKPENKTANETKKDNKKEKKPHNATKKAKPTPPTTP